MNSEHQHCSHSPFWNSAIPVFDLAVYSLVQSFSLSVLMYWDLFFSLCLRYATLMMPSLRPLLYQKASSVQGQWRESFPSRFTQAVMWPVSCCRARQPLWRLTGRSSAHTLGRQAELPPVASFRQPSSLTAEYRRRPGAPTARQSREFKMKKIFLLHTEVILTCPLLALLYQTRRDIRGACGQRIEGGKCMRVKKKKQTGY